MEADVEAQSPSDVLTWMATQGLRPVSLKAVGGLQATGIRKIFGASITVEDQVFLTKYLALMLKVGTDLFKAIDILIADFDKPVMKALLIEIRDNLGKGQPFYSTFAKYPKFFSPVFVNLIRAGEKSGNLEKVFDDLSVGLEKDAELRGSIKGALIYPTILVCMAILIILGMVTFALPKIAQSFSGNGITPPAFSAAVFAVGLFIGGNVVYILTILAALVVGGIFFFRSDLGKLVFNRMVSRIPVINEVIHRIALQRFASTLSSLMKAGMPIIESIEIAAEAGGSADMKAALLRISREGIAKGLTIGEAFRKEPYFPQVVVNLIAISEQAGHLENILETLAEFYEGEINSSVKTLVSFIEPALLVVIGVIVGLIALSIIIPVYQLTASVG
ncbi:MAG: type II secretion system F family protein [Patescibacteria group bacterium]|nr:type II secretion system F family protein [Patescibacteria group bacterium]MCL5224349.1 type II secretion system F family protein [Patescibacteria group bacterium]